MAARTVSPDVAILRALFQNPGGHVTGVRLAEELGCTRSAVWKRIENLQAVGYEIEAQPHLGYRLASAPDILVADELQARMPGHLFTRNLLVFRETKSTNDLLLREAQAGAPEGLCIVAESQSGGRGRLGRVWESQPGKGLWFSLLFRPNWPLTDAQRLTLITSVALCRSVESVTSLSCAIKWPNDVLLHGRKLAGILIETQGDTLGPLDVVVGVGLNVRLSPALLAEVDQPVADLAGGLPQPPSRNALLAMLLNELADVTDMFTQHGFAPFQDEWQRRHAFQDQAVVLRQPDGGAFHGIARGVDRDGALRLETPSGIDTVYAGDLSLRGAP